MSESWEFDTAAETPHSGDCLGTLCSHCGHCMHTGDQTPCRCNLDGCMCDVYSPLAPPEQVTKWDHRSLLEAQRRIRSDSRRNAAEYVLQEMLAEVTP